MCMETPFKPFCVLGLFILYTKITGQRNYKWLTGTIGSVINFYFLLNFKNNYEIYFSEWKLSRFISCQTTCLLASWPHCFDLLFYLYFSVIWRLVTLNVIFLGILRVGRYPATVQSMNKHSFVCIGNICLVCIKCQFSHWRLSHSFKPLHHRK